MERQFGPLSRSARKRNDAADPDELDAWLEQVLAFVNLEPVFDGSDQL